MCKQLEKILVTGYSGFIGRKLIKKLAKKYKIVGVSNVKNSIPYVIKIRKDIRKLSPNDLPKDISYIIHLAAISDVSYCQQNPSECFDVNVRGTQNLLEISRKIGSKFLFVSTSHVYGKPSKLPINEKHQKNPTSIYAASKLAGEIISESYAKNYGMDVSILRFFSVYGPNSPPHVVISKIINQLQTSNKITLGNLYPKRDFVFVEDVVNAIELVIKKSSSYEIFNVGSGKSFSIKEISNMLQKIAGRNIAVNSTPSLKRKQEIRNVIADISKIRKLGWKPQIPLKDGLQIAFKAGSGENN